LAASPVEKKYHFLITENQAGFRLDHFLVRNILDSSRSMLGRCIRSGLVVVNSHVVKPGYKIHPGDEIYVEIPQEQESHCAAQPVAFDILYQDDSLAVISKPPGLVVHPAAGHRDGTLVNGLLYHFSHLPELDNKRPGIVHRLDKDTSGIMLVAKTEKVQRKLTAAFKDRQIHKSYRAILLRNPPETTGRIVRPIGRHPVNRKKMAVNEKKGRYAATRWKILETFSNGLCSSEIVIETGRTHQIRVHMSSIGAPVAGDALYGGRVPEKAGIVVKRQLLHAATLSFNHPETGKECSFSAPLWDDMQNILYLLQKEYTLAT